VAFQRSGRPSPSAASNHVEGFLAEALGRIWKLRNGQTPPYKWWNWHDNYDAEASPDPKWVDIITDPIGAAVRRRDEEAKARGKERR
jgi:hypothetical protein